MLYKRTDYEREKLLPTSDLEPEPYRSPFRRDYARLIHCPSFRRLQGKTQLFPGPESDFFRNRLTHSLEVAQIAKSIAIKVNYDQRSHLLRDGSRFEIDTDLVEFSALAHDLGHPPFGHIGEDALDECMKLHGGFEGNAQTLRIIGKLEKRDTIGNEGELVDHEGHDLRVGLNLTYRSLASILKYDEVIPRERPERTRVFKGYYESESELVTKIKQHVVGDPTVKITTVECSIMDTADDIAYSTYDLEDAFKAGFLTPLMLLAAPDAVYEEVARQTNRKLQKEYTQQDVQDILHEIFGEIIPDDDAIVAASGLGIEDLDSYARRAVTVKLAYRTSEEIAQNSFYRTNLTSKFVGEFIRGAHCTVNDDTPEMSIVELSEDTRERVEVLKHFSYVSQVMSPRLKIVEYRGKEIVHELFNILMEGGIDLLPSDYGMLYASVAEDEKQRVICDFIAGMTDRYAVEFYGRLRSVEPQTIFKPL